METTDPNVMTEELTFCAVHPDRETSLRCNKCGRYMCVQCAVQTPVGYRCRECVRGHEDKFFNASQTDYIVVAVTCGILNLIGAYIAGMIGFLLVVLIAGFPVGGLIAEVALRLTQRRRGRYSAYVAAAGALVGGLLPLAYIFITRGRLVPDISLILFAVISSAAIYGRFQMRI